MRIATLLALVFTMLLGGATPSSAFDHGRYLPTSGSDWPDVTAQTHRAPAQSESRNPEALSPKPILAKALRRCRTFPAHCTLKS